MLIAVLSILQGTIFSVLDGAFNFPSVALSLLIMTVGAFCAALIIDFTNKRYQKVIKAGFDNEKFSFSLVHKHYGEFITGAIFGPLAVNLTYFLQTGRMSSILFLLSASGGLIISAMAIIAGTVNYRRDKASGYRTLPSILDFATYRIIFQVCILAPYLLIIAAILMNSGFFPVLLTFLSITYALRIARGLNHEKGPLAEFAGRVFGSGYIVYTLKYYIIFTFLLYGGLILTVIYKVFMEPHG